MNERMTLEFLCDFESSRCVRLTRASGLARKARVL